MALPSSGQIFMSQIAQELGISAVGLTLNDPRVRQLAGKPSGPVWFSDFYGKSNGYSGVLVVGSESSGRMRGFSTDGRSGYTNAIYGSLTPAATPYGTCSHFFWGADGVYLKIPDSPAYTVFNVSMNGGEAQLRNGVYEYWDDTTTALQAKLNQINNNGSRGTLTITK
ncbi:hypothetical protein [Aeromonas veronii]|uniref:hypothetical protein n=1 Tax=Aeromonas veronii TaxID=654 RepID=UPI003BA0F0FB